MQIYTLFISFVLASVAVSTALPQTAPRDDDNDTFDLSDIDLSELNSTDVQDFTVDIERPDAIPDDDEPELDARTTIGERVVAAAEAYLGLWYHFGGGCHPGQPSSFTADKKSGIDCSCLARAAVWKGANVKIPRTAKAQYASKRGTKIPVASRKPGDLVFWGCGEKGGIHHVAITETKPNWIIQAPKTGSHVQKHKIWHSGLCRYAVRFW